MPNSNRPSGDYVRQCLRYEDGRLFWLERPRSHFASERGWKAFNTRFKGKESGGIIFQPYRATKIPRWSIRLDFRAYYRYQIVWLIHNGEIPLKIDHVNRNQLDDRIENLRICTQAQNMQNSEKRRDNASGFKGVSWMERYGKFRAYIRANGRQLHLGVFDSPTEAHAAYVAAAKKHFGEFACDG